MPASLLDSSIAPLAGAVDALVGADVHGLADCQLLDAVEELHRLRGRLAAVEADLLRVADTRAATVAECGRATRSWLVEELCVGPADASRRLRLARELGTAPAVDEALHAGDISADHALTILKVLAQVPPHVRDVVEAELVKVAREHPPHVLAQLVDQILVLFGVERSADEAAARRHGERGVDLDETFGGFGSLGGLLSPEVKEALRLALEAAAAPTGPEDERSARQRRHDALGDIADFYLGHADVPDVNGERPRVVVTIPLQSLLEELSQQWGLLDSGAPISPATARRLACDAEIIPAVLGARGEVLDLGVASRTFSTSVRRAAKIRDGGRCAFPRCRRPIAECHHLIWWSHGGRSSIDNAAWLCTFHHWLVHEGGWTLHRNPNGSYTWTSPKGRTITGDPPGTRAGPERVLR